MAATRDPNTLQHKLRWLLGLLGLVVVALVVAAMAWCPQQPVYHGPVRHVVVISLDTTRADHFGCYGNTWIRTPRIDALADEAVLFADYMTVVPTTLASHVSLFTGKYPHTHGVPRNGFVVHADNVMLAEILKEADFHTAGFLASFALDKRFNFAQGFDYFDQEFDILANGREIDQNQRRAQAVTDAVIAYLDREGVPPNLFLFVHYFDSHMPYDPPPPYDTMYGEAKGAIKLGDHPALLGGYRPRQLRQFLCRHAGEVSYMDQHVGRLLDDLKRRGILDQALLVVTSDHGENLGDEASHLFDHGWTTYQSVMHAVGVIRLPGAAHGGTRLDLPVASIDILPTVLNYLELPTPTGVDGQVIDLTNPRQTTMSRTRFGEATKPWDEVETDPRWLNNRKARCVREGPFKYIYTSYRGSEELYDLSSDPHERRNLLASRTPELARRAAGLRRKLDAWTATQKPLPSHFDRGQREETIRRLKALGYLSTDDDGD
ncbi:MAG: sulfatase [Phycisphaerae bacterium]